MVSPLFDISCQDQKLLEELFRSKSLSWKKIYDKMLSGVKESCSSRNCDVYYMPDVEGGYVAIRIKTADSEEGLESVIKLSDYFRREFGSDVAVHLIPYYASP